MQPIANNFMVRLTQQKIQFEKEKVCEEEQKRRMALNLPLLSLFLKRVLKVSKSKHLKKYSNKKKHNALLKAFMKFEYQEKQKQKRKRLEQEENEENLLEKKRSKMKVPEKELEFYLSMLTKK